MVRVRLVNPNRPGLASLLPVGILCLFTGHFEVPEIMQYQSRSQRRLWGAWASGVRNVSDRDEAMICGTA